ncbi:MAG: hypothetical protein EAX95_00195 [Candidatus Thorarchaeota archaeon]|nr:hypothetical protein [Candidatus Thorarchaeota archaeon]
MLPICPQLQDQLLHTAKCKLTSTPTLCYLEDGFLMRNWKPHLILILSETGSCIRFHAPAVAPFLLSQSREDCLFDRIF